ncbi:alpha/beta hydrolase [Nocardia iowensis]|uniref:Alpha/beta hydrolase n=1 Tax=Nocardia iowensis TaxID=204891 RepID=A0ABX8RJY3_NOCIO|nr:alpha/beta hydrolase [Nocardia iowensis]QXN89207.1 alpha/beta hydrolase [Nocardia iowensis]
MTEEIIPLWPESAAGKPNPYGQETTVPAVVGHKDVTLIRNVTEPALTVHRPDPSRATGTAVIVCPGGSFVTLTNGTGTAIAKALAAYGFTAFVLRYRLLPSAPRDEDFAKQWATDYRMDEIKSQSRVAGADAVRAVQVVREQASTWDLDPHRIGVLGFSAGGLLTIGAATTYDEHSRPDFAAAIYGPPWHEYVVPPDAPPLFIAFASDDTGENVVNGNLALYQAWQAAGHDVEMHVYARGGHGFAMEPQGLPCDTWMDRFLDWVRAG